MRDVTSSKPKSVPNAVHLGVKLTDNESFQQASDGIEHYGRTVIGKIGSGRIFCFITWSRVKSCLLI